MLALYIHAYKQTNVDINLQWKKLKEKKIELLLGTLFSSLHIFIYLFIYLSIYVFVFVHSPGLNLLTSSSVLERDLIFVKF